MLTALARQTVLEMAKVAMALKFALDWRHSFLVPSRNQQLVDFWLFPDVHTQQLEGADIDGVNHGLQDPLVPKLAIAHLPDLVDARRNSARRPSRIHALCNYVWMTRSSGLWIDGKSDLFS